MKIQLRQVGDVIVLDLSGKVTLGQGDEALLAKVGELVDGGGTKHLLVNLEHVPYMDSSGLSTLVLCYKRATAAGATIKLLNTRKRVYDLLHVVKLDTIFESFTTEVQAIASFGSA